MKHVDLGEPSSFLEHSNVQVNPDESMVDEYRKMFKSRIYICQRNRMRTRSLSQMTWEDVRRNA